MPLRARAHRALTSELQPSYRLPGELSLHHYQAQRRVRDNVDT